VGHARDLGFKIRAPVALPPNSLGAVYESTGKPELRKPFTNVAWTSINYRTHLSHPTCSGDAFDIAGLERQPGTARWPGPKEQSPFETVECQARVSICVSKSFVTNLKSAILSVKMAHLAVLSY
jgi:hypothetical protein